VADIFFRAVILSLISCYGLIAGFCLILSSPALSSNEALNSKAGGLPLSEWITEEVFTPSSLRSLNLLKLGVAPD